MPCTKGLSQVTPLECCALRLGSYIRPAASEEVEELETVKCPKVEVFRDPQTFGVQKAKDAMRLFRLTVRS